MSAFSVSDLLNPAPLSTDGSPGPEDTVMDDAPIDVPAGLFAPELFQTEGASQMQDLTHGSLEHADQPVSPVLDRRPSLAGSESLSRVDTLDENGQPKKKKTTKADPEKKKDTKHSSKNEGQHTDRRYLCYLCHKLFTRRRSVRDHLVKIHGEKTWEPTKSLEIAVHPGTGEPIESIADVVARGPPPPPPKEANEGEGTGTPDPDTGLNNVESTPQVEDGPDVANPESEEMFDSVPELPTTTMDAPLMTMKEASPAPKPESSPSKPQPPPVEAEPPKIKVEAAVVERRSVSRPASIEPSQPSQVIGKKRPLPINKKGTAKKSATPNKRPKFTDSKESTPASVRSPSASVTPATKIGSKLKKALASPAPSSRASSRQASPSPSVSAVSAASSNDDGEVFCICRKGDNHTWMIACDGGCEEWYHGKCVNIKERDGSLIDKYVCARCEKDGFVTTWKRMCRRKGCRKPAKIHEEKNAPPSKYCSKECGRLFFVDLVRRGDAAADASHDGLKILAMSKEKKTKPKPHRRHVHANGNDTPMLDSSRPQTPAYSDDENMEYETDSSADEDDLPNRGGALRAGEVKALLEQCRSVDDWRVLGRKPATPPRDDQMKDANDELTLDEFEKARLIKIKSDSSAISERSSLLDAREKFLDLVKTRSAGIADEVKKSNPKLKDVCGYDPRVAWSEDEFALWYKAEGKQAVDRGQIGKLADDDAVMTGAADEEDEEEKAKTTKGGVCIRNRCPKHGSNKWQKAQLAELRFEQELIRKKMESLQAQEREIQGRAQIRAWERRI